MLLIPLIVILEPYKGIRYNQTNVYIIKKEYAEKVMEIYEAEETESPDDGDDRSWKEYLELKYGKD